MGKVIKKKLNGMSWWAKTSLILLLTLATSVFMYQGWYKPAPAAAAVAQLQAFTNIYHAAAYPTTIATNYAVGAGTDRVLVLAIASDKDATGVQTGPTSVTYGGTAMTMAIGDAAVSARQHTYLYYLKDTPAVMDGTARPIVITGMAGTNAVINDVYVAVYTGVDQTTTIRNAQNYCVSAAATPAAFATALTVNTGDQAVMVWNSPDSTTTTAPTVTMPANWTLAAQQTWTTTLGVRTIVGSRTIPGTNTTDTASTTISANGRMAMSAMSLIASAAPAGGTLAVSTTTQSVSEGVGNATISVTRTGGSTGAVTVDYTTADVSALAGSDYTFTTGTLSWAAGDTAAKTITVPITDDTTDESNETFTVTLSNATNGATLGTATQTVTITDNDVPTVQFQSATSSGGEGTTPAAITVTLSVTPISNVTVNYTTTAGTATAGSDYTTTSGTLTITAPATSGTINVPIIDDGASESSETFTVTLSAPGNATLGATTVHTRTIVDNDGPIATITSCTQCHNGYPSLTDAATRNAIPGAFPGSHGVSGHGTDCTVCHASNVAFDHSNGTINMAASIAGGSYGKGASWAATNTPSALMTCSTTTCHGTTSPAWGSTGVGGCATCHSDTTATASFKTTAGTTNSTSSTLHVSHLNRTHAMSTTVITCADCHAVPGAFSDAGHANTALPAEVNAGLGYNGTSCGTASCHGSKAPAWTATMLNSTIADCSKCHDLPPTPGAGSHVSIPSAITTIAGLSACSSLATGCHPTISAAPSTYANIFADAAKHINGSIEGGSCVGCHSTGGAADVAGRVAVASQFTAAGNSHHYQGAAAIDGKACYACHWESDSNGNKTASHAGTAGAAIDLVIWNATSRPGTNTPGTTSVAYTSGGAATTPRSEIAKINNHCLGCHSAQNLNTATFTGDTNTTSQYSPEPKMVPALAKTSVLSRYSSTRTVPWSNYAFTNSSGNVVQYGTNQKKLVTKALSAHGKATLNKFPKWDATANGKGEDETMADAAASATLSNNRNVFCYDCHNSHGSDVSASGAITSSYSSATGRYKGGLLKSTVAGKGGYTVTYKPAARTISYRNYSSTTLTTSALFNAGASICNDCHNNDTRKVNISRPWSIQGTYSSTTAINGYWSTPYFDNYTFASAKRTVYKAGGAVNTIKDLRKPRGGHFGSSVNGAQAGHSGEINGLCTPCHDPHGISSSMTAVNRGKSVPLLKGTWVTSPYREDRATPVVKRGGGRNFTGVAAMGAMPGYNIDQNTLINLPAVTAGGGGVTTAEGNQRKQAFTAFPGAAGNALALHTEKTPADFAGLCIGCHNQASLTNATAPAAGNWMSMQRVHQSVAGWAATTGSNANGTVHAYTCSKCHAPHVSRLPRLLITNCLDVRHTKRVVAGGSIVATPPATTPGFAYGNVMQSYASSGKGAGRFPAGGSRYNGTPASAQNNGPWYFQTVQPAAAAYGSNCHNSATAGGATYDPTKQIWNKKSRW